MEYFGCGMDITKGVVVKEYGCEGRYRAHEAGFICFGIKNNVFEYRVVEICILDVVDFYDDINEGRSRLIGIWLYANFTMAIENGVGAIGSIDACCERSGSVVGEGLEERQGYTGHTLSRSSKTALVCPHVS